jgi:hypothetical protein
MKYIDVTYTAEQCMSMFPCGDEGENVQASAEADAIASHHLATPVEQIVWHLPDVFAVRYGSNYVATASFGGLAVRFHSTQGDFRDGDDK